jgi:hypothetical protein
LIPVLARRDHHGSPLDGSSDLEDRSHSSQDAVSGDEQVPAHRPVTTVKTKASKVMESLTAFSRTDRTVLDYGTHAGHLAGR